MVDWTKSMKQDFEYFIVDPKSWTDSHRLTKVKSCTINRDSTAETLGSASIDTDEVIGEQYIRVYLVTIQNGVKERHPLGTFLAQTPSVSFDGMTSNVSIDAYTPLMELKENSPPLGFSVLKGENIMDAAYVAAKEHMRAPVIKPSSEEKLYSDFVANTDDTWLGLVSDLSANDKKRVDLDELGRLIFQPIQPLDSMQPVWTYTDDNTSILQPEASWTKDLYGIPNVIEIIYTKGDHTAYYRVVNDDPNSITSTVSRGREIVSRIVNPDSLGLANDDMIKEYAEQTLKNVSTISYDIDYTHGYCPVRIGDCIRLNYKRAGLNNIKGKVVSQSIRCEPGCPVSEKATFVLKLWR